MIPIPGPQLYRAIADVLLGVSIVAGAGIVLLLLACVTSTLQ